MTKATTSTAPRIVDVEEVGATGADMAELGYEPRTELGRLARAARKAYFAAGGKPLTREEINAEVSRRRGGVHLLGDQ